MNRRLVISIAAALAMVGVIGYLAIGGLWADHASREDATSRRSPPSGEITDRGAEIATARRSLPALRSAAAAAPLDPDAQAKLGDAELRSGEQARAIAAYRAAIAIDDRRAAIWSSLGEAYVEATRVDGPRMPPEAKAAFARAIALEPGDLRARFYLAGEKDAAGDHDAAMDDWIAVLSAVPRGSPPDRAVRAAIGGAMRRNLKNLSDRLNAAMRDQPAG